jgi:uncharacterized protein YigA (DUF484 family)
MDQKIQEMEQETAQEIQEATANAASQSDLNQQISNVTNQMSNMASQQWVSDQMQDVATQDWVTEQVGTVVWAGETTDANVQATYANYPVGTIVAFWIRSNFMYNNSNGGYAAWDRSYRRLRKTESGWVSN